MPSPRERQEMWELRDLAPWAAKAAESKGRERDEPQDLVRTVFQRDRDRVLHSKAFRRLKHKTQVFIDPEEDHFRTRLTHTLEVSQIARTIARALRLNEDLAEAVALAHDLGHPPFGHAGEEALDNAIREFVPGASFRHDEQSLRVVDILEIGTGAPVHEAGGSHVVQGLNLTWEVRNGIARHSKGRRGLQDTSRELAATLEGKAVRIADRIAYINHDIDDAIRAGVIAPDDLPRDQLDSLGHSHSERISTMVEDVVRNSLDAPTVEMSSDVAAATDELKEFLFERVYWNGSTGNNDLRKAQHVIRALFCLYMDQPVQMNGQPGLEELSVPERAQKVCDFIAGMTDRYAVACFDRQFVPKGVRGASSL
jgi:dGTPase